MPSWIIFTRRIPIYISSLDRMTRQIIEFPVWEVICRVAWTLSFFSVLNRFDKLQFRIRSNCLLSFKGTLTHSFLRGMIVSLRSSYILCICVVLLTIVSSFLYWLHINTSTSAFLTATRRRQCTTCVLISKAKVLHVQFHLFEFLGFAPLLSLLFCDTLCSWCPGDLNE
jgi:hypothetical protein